MEMKTITLKLTDHQILLLDDVIHNSNFGRSLNLLFDDEKAVIFKPTAQRLNIKLTSNEILVQDVDKFRKFLTDEIHSLEMKSRNEYGYSDNINDFKSILSKLDKVLI